MATQVLNFGVPAQVDVQVQGRDRAANQVIAKELQKRLAAIPGIVDSHVPQELDAPELEYTVNRTRAQELGLNVATIANNVNVSLSSSEQVSPNFWTDPKNGIPYFFAVQTPEYRIASKRDIDNTPISGTPSRSAAVPQCRSAAVPDLLGNVAIAQRVPVQSVYNHSNIQPVYDVYASVQDRDLGGTAAAIQNVVRKMRVKLGPADHIVVLGQIGSMNGAFTNLTIGLLFAAVFVYALMVVNYQSFIDPLAVMLALPGAPPLRNGPIPITVIRNTVPAAGRVRTVSGP
jgi:multidrug efflux pump subunit AcrB